MIFSSEPFPRRLSQDQDEQNCRKVSEDASTDWHFFQLDFAVSKAEILL